MRPASSIEIFLLVASERTSTASPSNSAPCSSASFSTKRASAFADLPRSAYGYYRLVFLNEHEPVTSRYQASVSTDGSARLKILHQHLIDRQRELSVEFSVTEDAGYTERNRT